MAQPVVDHELEPGGSGEVEGGRWIVEVPLAHSHPDAFEDGQRERQWQAVPPPRLVDGLGNTHEPLRPRASTADHAIHKGWAGHLVTVGGLPPTGSGLRRSGFLIACNPVALAADPVEAHRFVKPLHLRQAMVLESKPLAEADLADRARYQDAAGVTMRGQAGRQL